MRNDNQNFTNTDATIIAIMLTILGYIIYRLLTT